jgi:predicted dienelactone hydrolase
VVVAIGHPGEASALKYKDGRIIKISQNHLESMTNPKLFEDLEPLFDEIKATAEEENELLVKLTRKFHSIQPFNVRVKPWVIDTTKTVDFLKKLNQGEVPSLFRGKLNLEIGLGITGHSFGGSTAIQTLHDDPRFVCGVNVDGGHFGDYYGEDIQKPLLMIGNPHIWKLIKAVFLSNSKDVYHLTVKNADHLGFTDFIYILKNPDENSRIGSRNPDDFRLLLSTYQLNFFNQYLLQKGSALEDLHFEETRFYKKLAGKH